MVVVSNSYDPPTEGLLKHIQRSKLIVNNTELGTGNLYVTESSVVWASGVLPQGGPAPMVSLLYPTIVLHAVQREPVDALYMVLNYELPLLTVEQEPVSDNEFDPNQVAMTQLRFVFDTEQELQDVYHALCQGQSLNPDHVEGDSDSSNDSFEDGDGDDVDDDEEFEDAEEQNEADGAGDTEDAASRIRDMRIDNVNGLNNEQNGVSEMEK